MHSGCYPPIGGWSKREDVGFTEINKKNGYVFDLLSNRVLRCGWYYVSESAFGNTLSKNANEIVCGAHAKHN